jgi:general secretion pathway protein E
MEPTSPDTVEPSSETTHPGTVLVVNSPAYLCGRPIGEILMVTAKLSPDKLEEALRTQSEKGGRLGEVLVGMKVLTEEQVLRALAVQLDLPFSEKIDVKAIDLEQIKKIPISFARQGKVLVLGKEGDAVVIALSDPLDTSLVDRVRMLVGGQVVQRVYPSHVLEDAINQAYDNLVNSAEDTFGSDNESEVDNDDGSLDDDDLIQKQGDDEAPIIRLVNRIMYRASKERASDIHVEPMDRYLSVRFREDGVLREVVRLPKHMQKAVASRIKILGGLNIAETRLPQDGRIRIKIAGKDVDIRLSTVPTAHGERLVLRLLDKSAVLLDLKEIGFSPDQLDVMHALIDKSHGIILVTGPTGSGKTTTLYAALTRINKPDLNILTIEDPIEYQINGIGQVPINPKIGLTFAHGLRSFLRQDPDVIMVGEIRDLETAEIAIQASLTGHLVMSTVHTNDAPGALTRLVEMGVEPFLVASSLIGVLAQRLVRVLCKHCRQPYEPSADELIRVGLTAEDMRSMGQTHWNRPVGCPECNKGYRGRTGIYELMTIDDSIRQLILGKKDSNTIKHQATANGMRTLIADGARKVAMGITTAEEVLRVTQEDT